MSKLVPLETEVDPDGLSVEHILTRPEVITGCEISPCGTKLLLKTTRNAYVFVVTPKRPWEKWAEQHPDLVGLEMLEIHNSTYRSSTVIAFKHHTGATYYVWLRDNFFDTLTSRTSSWHKPVRMYRIVAD